MTNTSGANAHVPICPLSIDDALTLRDLQCRACSIERLLFAWPNDEKWRVTRVTRPTRRNLLSGPQGPDERNGPPIYCRSDADDAYLLLLQLQRPEDLVAQLHRSLQGLLAGRIGHLKPSDQRLMTMPSVLWVGANEISHQAIVDLVVRFQLCKLSVAEVRQAASVARRVVRIAQEHVVAVEDFRLALASNEPLINLDRPVDQLEDPPSWYEFEAPGPNNAPWGA